MNGPIPVPASPGVGHPSRLTFIPPRTRRLVLVALTGVVLTFAAVDAALIIPVSFFYEGGTLVGMDYGIYMDRTHDWLAGDGFYRDHSSPGLRTRSRTATLFYPPTLLYMLVPFALGLPAVVWWLIPIAIIARLVRIRPPDRTGPSWRSPCCSREPPSFWFWATPRSG